MSKFRLVWLGLFCCLSGAEAQSQVQQLIDTRIGTAANTTASAGLFGKHTEEYGQTLPAVLVPHGMNFWTPQTQDTERKCMAPYYYKDSRIQGFRNSHWIVGGCTQDYGSMTLMTVTDSLRLRPTERASAFSHVKETATPSYYSVYLDDYQTVAELTAQSRSALFRFTYRKGGMAYLVVNPNSDYGKGFIEIDTARKEIRGYNPVHRIYQGWGEEAGFSGYFVVRFEKPIRTFGVYNATQVFENKASMGNEPQIGAYVGFQMQEGGQLLVKAASSFVDSEGACRNLDHEIPHWNFEALRLQLAETWNRHLASLEIKGTLPQQAQFYGAFYRASFLPRVFNDVDGRYPAFSKGQPICRTEEGDYYDDFSCWDTYRALHPLLTLVDTQRTGEMVRSLLDKYTQGGWLPIFPCWNSYTAAMIGDHCISVIGDALLKGIKGFDSEKAYEAMRKNAFESPATYEEYASGKGRRALRSYLTYGYIPLEDSVAEAYHTCEQVSRTLEYAYDDFVLAQVARRLGYEEDARQLFQRALHYRKVINPATGYAQGRYADGRFLQADNAFRFTGFITEGVPAHYTWYVPHDVRGLARCMGGKSAFVAKLDSLFCERRYWHGNEPCHQIPYLYNYVGQPWKTQQQVAYIRRTEYANTPGGLSGNDDAGQMSAWYIFSALGFYPVCPGASYYAIGSPAFEQVTLRMDNGRTFIIRAQGVSEENCYIQSACLNGKRFTKTYLTHAQLRQGGTLELVMGATPNKKWGNRKADCPPSLTH